MIPCRHTLHGRAAAAQFYGGTLAPENVRWRTNSATVPILSNLVQYCPILAHATKSFGIPILAMGRVAFAAGIGEYWSAQPPTQGDLHDHRDP
jgi:hypothetical protein